MCIRDWYIAHVDDWKSLAPAWWAAMPRVHEQYPHLLAEMYALTMSAANLTTPWSQLSSYMVSDPRTMSPTEAWAWIDDLATREGPGAVCAGARATCASSLARAAKKQVRKCPPVPTPCAHHALTNLSPVTQQENRLQTEL